MKGRVVQKNDQEFTRVGSWKPWRKRSKNFLLIVNL